MEKCSCQRLLLLLLVSPVASFMVMAAQPGMTRSWSRKDVLQLGLFLGAGTTATWMATTVAPQPAWSADDDDAIYPNVTEPAFTSTVYMDIESNGGGKPIGGRIEIGLYGDVVPKTVANFQSLCDGSNGVSYQGSNIYKILKDFNVQAGDIGAKKRGSTGTSSTGQPLERENFRIKHALEGLVSMAIDKDKKVDSRFFITLAQDSGWADGRYVCFGRVTKGLDVLKELQKLDIASNGVPSSKVIIKACGTLTSSS